MKVDKGMVAAAAGIYVADATISEGSARVGVATFEKVLNDVVKLPGGMETVQAVDNARTVANAGAIEAAGILAMNAYRDNRTEAFTFSAEQGANELDVHVTAAKTVKLNFAKDGEPTEKTIHGSTQIMYRTQDVSQTGAIGQARKELKENFGNLWAELNK